MNNLKEISENMTSFDFNLRNHRSMVEMNEKNDGGGVGESSSPRAAFSPDGSIQIEFTSPPFVDEFTPV